MRIEWGEEDLRSSSSAPLAVVAREGGKFGESPVGAKRLMRVKALTGADTG
jgi:hypothetical protein